MPDKVIIIINKSLSNNDCMGGYDWCSHSRIVNFYQESVNEASIIYLLFQESNANSYRVAKGNDVPPRKYE